MEVEVSDEFLRYLALESTLGLRPGHGVIL
jgi:hypothetical protein